MEVNYKKVILRTTLWTLTSLVLATAIFVCVMVFAFPQKMGDFAYSLGMNNLSAGMYQKAYEKDGNIAYAYKALNLQIKQKNYKKVVEVYDLFEKDQDYDDFMTQLKAHNEKVTAGLLEKSTLLSEENFVVNSYVRALINVGEEQKAYQISINNLKALQYASFKDQGVYSMYQFVGKQGFDDFDFEPAGFEKSLIETIKDYYNSSLNIFDENKVCESQLDKAYLISLGNRIILVGQNIKKICSSDTAIVSSIEEQLTNVNNVLKEVL